MHISLLPTSTPPVAEPEQALLETSLSWLQAELELTELPDRKAALRHELGVLQELAGRDSLAVRELLAAVNATPRFKEPLERLIAVIERRRSFKNLPTLLEHLCRTADTPEEEARAQLLQAWCALVHGRDEQRALQAVEAALRAVPNEPAALLSLEVMARRRGDSTLLQRALEGQLSAGENPSLAHYSSLELAELSIAQGQAERAHVLLTAASAEPGALGLRALELRARLGRTSRHIEWTLEALTLQAARILVSAAPGERNPASARAPARALAALMELAELQSSLGHEEDAVDTLERALDIDPRDPLAAAALLRQAEKTGRHACVERLVAAEIEALRQGPERAALAVRWAESRLARNEPLLALDALELALSADPECWVARAFQLDLLRGTRNAEGHARALEQLAEQLTDVRGKIRQWLLAALGYALRAGDVGAARRALAYAEQSGADPGLVARLSRALSFASGDADWSEEATRRLLETETSSSEQAGLLLECWRTVLLAGDKPSLPTTGPSAAAERTRIEQALAGLPEGRTAARLARAYAPASAAAPADAADALLALAEQAGEGATGAALAWTAALRLIGAGENARARQCLERLHRQEPSACLVTGTLIAFLERNAALPAELADVLVSTAAALTDAEFAASLCIEAGLRRWQGGRSSAAALDFEASERHVPGAGSALAFWARRASQSCLGTTDERDSEPEERLLAALERAIRASPADTGALSELQNALHAVGDDSSPLASAARLQALLQGQMLGQRSDPALLERLSTLNADASRLIDAWRYLECITRAEPPAETLEEVTRKWSESSESLASALEWLAATQRLGQPARECQARYRLSELLSGNAAELCAASGALVAQLSGAAPAAFLVGSAAPLRLTNLESSPPGCDPRRRARALEDVSQLLGAENEPSLALLRGYNLLAAGESAAAVPAFQRYAQAFPDDPAGFEGLRAAARDGGDPSVLAEATAALGRCSRDPAHAARLFEEAADIFFDRVHDASAGEAALRRAVELDIRRKSSFDRLFAWVRDQGDAARLLELCQRRLLVSVSADEQLELEWESARASRKLDDTAAASSALERVLSLDPQHGGALALLGEISITTRRYAEAADALARLASLPGTPAPERLTSGLYAVDLFENQLDATPRALEVLLMLHRAGLSTLAVRERLARAAAKSSSWDEAVVVLEQLMFERVTPEERAEAARLALAIHRDRRNDARSAGHAAEALLALIPHDAEALDLALSGSLEPLLTDKLLRASQGALEQRLGQDPFQLDSLKRLARVADRTGDLGVRQVSLGALLALGQGPSSGTRAELAALDQRLAALPTVAWTPELLGELSDPDDRGPVGELLALVAPHLVRALGPDSKTFQVTRRERILPSSGLPIRSEVAVWVSALGLGEFELYQSPVGAERIVALATEPLSVIVGSRVIAPLAPFQRQELVRGLFALRRQQGVLTQLDEIDVAALVVALCNLAQQPLAAPNYARQADFERQLNRILPRKIRKLLPERAQPLQSVGVDVGRWVSAALASLDRAAAVAVGDISLVLADRPPAERQQSSPAPPNERTRRVASFVLSPGFQWLRQRFGVRLA